MSDFIITQERISWQASLREFHQLERDDEKQTLAVKALEQIYRDHQLHGEDLEKKLADAIKAQLPIDQKHDELVYKVDKAKTSMEKEKANRKEVEKLLCHEMQLKDNQIGMEREMLEQRYRNEIERKEKNWERERVKMKADCVIFNERLIIAEGEIEEMMKCQDEQAHMRKEHFDQMVLLKAEFKSDEEKWKVGNEKIQCQQTELRTQMRSNEVLRSEACKDKKDKFRTEKAMKDMAWKKEKSKMVKNNRILVLKSSFTEHWISDLEEQIRTVGIEILEMKESLKLTLQELEEKCLKVLRKQAIDPEPLKHLFRTDLNLDKMIPSGNRKNSVWQVVDGWKQRGPH